MLNESRTARSARTRTHAPRGCLRGGAWRRPVAALLISGILGAVSEPARAQRQFPPPSDGLHGTVETGYREEGGAGSLRRYRKYVTWPQDLDAPALRLGWWRGGFEHIAVTAAHPFERDQWFSARLSNPRPYFRLEWDAQDNTFYLDPRAGASYRQVVSTSAHYGPSDGKFWISLNRPLREVRVQKQEVAAGARVTYPVTYHSRDLEARGSYSFGSSSLGTEFRHGEMEDSSRLPSRAGTELVVQPRDWSSREWRAYYSLLTPGLGALTAAYWNTSRHQRQPAGVSETATLASQQWAADWSASPGIFDVGLSLGGSSASQPSTLSSWARRTRTTSLFGGLRPLPGLSLQAGYSRKKVSWVRSRADFSEQLSTDKPIWNSLWFDARYRPYPLYSLRFQAQELRLAQMPRVGPPPVGATLSPVWYDRIHRWEARAEASPLDRLSLYATLTRDLRHNPTWSELLSRRATLGAWLQVTSVLGLNATYWRDSFTSRGFAHYYSTRTRAHDLTLSYQPGGLWSADAGWGESRTKGTEDVNEESSFLAVGYRLTPSQHLTLELQRSRFRDFLDPEMDYLANILWIRSAFSF